MIVFDYDCVFFRYADRQNLLNLEAVEIGDKEAEESPVESDEDEVTEETSLENKEKRKERIKRLLHEKSKKVSQETDVIENVISNSPSNNETVTEKNESETNAAKSDGKNEDKEEKIQEPVKDPLEHENPESNEQDTIQTLSDDSNKLDSDIDELNLLQKLHSGNEVDTSTLESSDSDTPIAISDTLSSGDNKVPESDVISIENSSYSESEDKAETNSYEKIESTGNETKEKEIEACSSNKDKELVDKPENKMESDIDLAAKTCDLNTEIECSNAGVEIKVHKSNNDEYNESIEDILLASSDDEPESKDAENKVNDSKPENNIEEIESSETVTQESNSNAEVLSLDEETNSNRTDSPGNENCLNLRDEVISIGDSLGEEPQKPVENAESEVSQTNTCDEKPDKIDSALEIHGRKTPEPMEQDNETDKTNGKIDSDDSKVVEERKSHDGGLDKSDAMDVDNTQNVSQNNSEN